MQSEIRIKDQVIQFVDFNLNVIKLMIGNEKLELSDKAKEKIIHHTSSFFGTGPVDSYKSEIELALESAAKKCKNNLIEPDDIIFKSQNQLDLDLPTGLKLEELERKYILQTLYFVEQNRTKAADLLGISIRTLRNKLNQYRLEGYL